MNKKIIIDASFSEEIRVCILNKFNKIKFFEFDSTNKSSLRGNIYLGKITRVEPSLQAAFVDFGYEKSGFLPFAEISSDYYHIPIGDKKLKKEQLDPPNEKIPTKLELNIEEKDLLSSEDLELSGLDIDQEKIDIQEVTNLVNNANQPVIDIAESDAEEERYDKSNVNLDKNTLYKIQEVISKGDIVLVQVIKDEKGNKGSTLSTFISLAGKYCILMPNATRNNAVSKKITHSNERLRLKNIVDSLLNQESNTSARVIIRTAAIGQNAQEIAKDYHYLTRFWNKMRNVTLGSKAPCFIHNEDSILLKIVRDFLDKNIQEVLIQGTSTYKNFIKLVNNIAPSMLPIIKEYSKSKPIFSEYQLEEQIAKLYQANVDLPSGGSIVIHHTEALIAIDVNSGKATDTRSIEEMALKTNIEASKTIASQVLLRNLSGLIVIDFIDMDLSQNQHIVERSLKEFFRYDKARVQIGKITSFGLLEMSRQRINPSFLELNTTICTSCNGKGLVRINDSNAMLILRTIENELANNKNIGEINVFANSVPAVFILNHKKTEVLSLEQKYKIKLNFYIDPSLSIDSFSIENIKKTKANKKDANYTAVLSHSISENLDASQSNDPPKSKDTATNTESSEENSARQTKRKKIKHI